MSSASGLETGAGRAAHLEATLARNGEGSMHDMLEVYPRRVLEHWTRGILACLCNHQVTTHGLQRLCIDFHPPTFPTLPVCSRSTNLYPRTHHPVLAPHTPCWSSTQVAPPTQRRNHLKRWRDSRWINVGGKKGGWELVRRGEGEGRGSFCLLI